MSALGRGETVGMDTITFADCTVCGEALFLNLRGKWETVWVKPTVLDRCRTACQPSED